MFTPLAFTAHTDQYKISRQDTTDNSYSLIFHAKILTAKPLRATREGNLREEFTRSAPEISSSKMFDNV